MRKTTVLLLLLSPVAFGQEKKIKTGLFPEDWKYTLAPGVTWREVTFYSGGTAVTPKSFLP